MLIFPGIAAIYIKESKIAEFSVKERGVFRNSTVNRRMCLRAGDDTWLRKNVSQKQ